MTTTINASAATVAAITRVLTRAAVLDDRAPRPDKARIAGWAEQVERHWLTEPDLLDGLQAYYDSPSERAIQIGDLIFHALRVRRDRNQREAEAERALADLPDAYRERVNQARLAAMLAVSKIGHHDDRPAPALGPRRIQCQHCKAEPGRRCINPSTGKPLHHPPHYHDSRIQAAARDQTSRRREHDAAIPLCDECGARPLVTAEAEHRGICDECADARPQPKPDTNGGRRNA